MEALRAINTIRQIKSYEIRLVDEYSNPVYKFCRSLTYTKEDAEDLFQETFLRALEQLDKIKASDNPQGFLFSTAVFIWKSWKRKYARRNRLVPVTRFDEASESGVDMEKSYIIQEENRAVRELVDALPEKFKIPTILYYALETSIPDIAAVLRIPAGTVKSRLFKARKLIAKGLEAVEHGK